MQHAISDGETRNYKAISSYNQCKIHRFCWIVARFRPEHQLEGKVKTIISYPQLQTPDNNLISMSKDLSITVQITCIIARFTQK